MLSFEGNELLHRRSINQVTWSATGILPTAQLQPSSLNLFRCHSSPIKFRFRFHGYLHSMCDAGAIAVVSSLSFNRPRHAVFPFRDFFDLLGNTGFVHFDIWIGRIEVAWEVVLVEFIKQDGEKGCIDVGVVVNFEVEVCVDSLKNGRTGNGIESVFELKSSILLLPFKPTFKASSKLCSTLSFMAT